MRLTLKSFGCGLLASWLAVAPVSGQTPQTLLFSAPPRGAEADERADFEPVAALLARATGLDIRYEYPREWLNYRNKMLDGKFDILFDGPHFVSWRMHKQSHQPLVRLPGQLVFVAVVRQDETAIQNADQLVGRRVCALAPPNLATLSVLSRFTGNIIRRPIVVEVVSFKDGYQGLTKTRKCDAAIMPMGAYKKMDEEAKLAKVVHTSEGYPNQAFSASPKLDETARAKITQALTSPEAGEVIKRFLQNYSQGKPLVAAKPEDYAAARTLLRDSWGFNK